MQQRHGYRVEPVTFSIPVKENLATRMLRVFQRGEIMIPDECSLLTELHSVEKQLTAAGNIRYAAPRSEGSHADRFMALALALHAGDHAHMGPILHVIEVGDSRCDPWPMLAVCRQA